jgi:alginate O-acetyltransferase complex protein AlgI
MIFTTWPFFLFMLVVFGIYWWLVPQRARRAFLLIASLAYFTYAYPPYTLLLGALTLITYAAGAQIMRGRARGADATGIRWVYALGVSLCVATLGFFKYSRMAASAVTWTLHALHLKGQVVAPSVLVPLGISFFTFEFVHYLTDVYLGKITKTSLLDFCVFAFYFPSLASGPVKRFQLFQEQGEQLKGFRSVYLADGLHRIALGIAKKVIVADTASILIGPLSAGGSTSRAWLWVAMYAYSVKIYYDFAGYSDIAIGCAHLLGYRLPENFAGPYRQSNLSKFWNKWHMSLSSWIRDYLFIPLGGSRAGSLRVAFNLVVVMAICGLWHGANWNFVAWGVWNGVGLAAVRAYRPWGARVPDTRAVRWLSTVVTYHFVCIGWVLFASPNLPAALGSLRVMLLGQ